MTERTYEFSMSNSDQNHAIQPGYFGIVLHETDGWENFETYEVNAEIHGNEIEIEVNGKSHTFTLPEIEEEEEE